MQLFEFLDRYLVIFIKSFENAKSFITFAKELISAFMMESSYFSAPAILRDDVCTYVSKLKKVVKMQQQKNTLFFWWAGSFVNGDRK